MAEKKYYTIKYSEKRYREFRKFLGKNILLYRTSRRLSRAELAELSSIKMLNIKGIEQGAGHFSVKDFLRLAFALEIEPYILLDTVYGTDSAARRAVVSSFSIAETTLTKAAMRRIYDDMVASGKYKPRDVENNNHSFV